MENNKTENSVAWQSKETMPKSGSFLIGVWEGEWREPKQRFRVYEARGFPSGPVWGRQYRTCEGEAYEVVGWMTKPAPNEENRALDESVNAMLAEINEIAMSRCNYEYGLPMHDNRAKARMREAVYKVLSQHILKGAT